MNKRKKRVAALACLLVAAAVAISVYLMNRGAPAIHADAYVQPRTQLTDASELQFLPGSIAEAPGMKLVAQTEALELYVHPETTEIAVKDRSSGKVWLSNPALRDEDSLATPHEKQVMASQFSILYRDSMGRGNTFLSFEKSVSNNQFQLEGIENGLRITYTLGDTSTGIDALPKFISVQRMEEKVLSQLDEATGKYVMNRYYPLKENPEVLERLDEAVSRQLVLVRMLDAFEQAGYTEEDLAYDNEENGISGGGTIADKPHFTVPLEYRLEADSLLVSIPVSQIEEAKGYRIRTVRLLEYFGAAGAEEQGYMLVPDGSGSLIYLNNGKSRDEIYAQRVYGEDENDNSFRRGQVAESVRLPVFGLKAGDDAWFAEIEQGDGIASIHADVSGRNNMYNNIFASFAIRGEDVLDLYKGNQVEEIRLLTDPYYPGDVAVRYHFLSGDQANYSGMAKLYREKLEREGVLKRLEGEEELPLYISLLGAVDVRKTILGVPYKGMHAMTTFEQASQLVQGMQQDGINNIRMRYLGWFNQGLNHKIASKVKHDRVLGSTKELQSLAAQLEKSGGRLYPDVAFQHVYRDDLQFAPASDAARFITREQALRTPYNRAFNAMDYDLGTYYLLSPAKLPYYVERFMKAYERYGFEAVSLRDLGDLLHADYRVNRIIFRETAKHIVNEQLDKVSKAYSDVLIAGGNAYALPYASHLVNVPTSTSVFNITDERVPFYQMVIHGYIDYAGSPINLDDQQDVQDHLLRSIEHGAAPHFLWSHTSSSKLKFTPYDGMFSTMYAAWYDQAVSMYKTANEVLGRLRTKRMEEHVQHQLGVIEVRYEDGTSVFINYNDQPAAVDGMVIPAKNFAVGGES